MAILAISDSEKNRQYLRLVQKEEEKKGEVEPEKQVDLWLLCELGSVLLCSGVVSVHRNLFIRFLPGSSLLETMSRSRFCYAQESFLSIEICS